MIDLARVISSDLFSVAMMTNWSFIPYNSPVHLAWESFFEPTDHRIVIIVMISSRKAKLGTYTYHPPSTHTPIWERDFRSMIKSSQVTLAWSQ